jgi:two-component system, NarL family, nitrate/nitrite response regulator NarL
VNIRQTLHSARTPLDEERGVDELEIEMDRLAGTLTPREREVLTRLVQGQGTKVMAREMAVGVRTVQDHVQGVLVKLHVHTRLEAIALAVSMCLVEDPTLFPLRGWMRW